MLPLYPPIKPYAVHNLKVCELHELYIEETGNPKGIPVVLLHFGPQPYQDGYLRRLFDPEWYRIIAFDMRGSGQSTPHNELRKNTTADALSDITAVVNLLKLQDFVLFGEGFGSLIALLYAKAHPKRIQALMLHQVFLARKEEINWFYQKGASEIYPDYWEDFVQQIPRENKNAIPQYYQHRLQSKNELERMAAAKNWALWHARTNRLDPDPSLIEHYCSPHFALNYAMLSIHYLVNDFFIPKRPVLKNIHKISSIPCYLIHGRYDMVTPVKSAWRLKSALPSCQLYLVRDAGHSSLEEGIIDALILASRSIIKQLNNAC